LFIKENPELLRVLDLHTSTTNHHMCNQTNNTGGVMYLSSRKHNKRMSSSCPVTQELITFRAWGLVGLFNIPFVCVKYELELPSDNHSLSKWQIIHCQLCGNPDTVIIFHKWLHYGMYPSTGTPSIGCPL
jgi:hypothetical protein